MDSVISFARKLIPFATPGTPLFQDILYTGAIIACAVVLAAERLQRRGGQRPENNVNLDGVGTEHVDAGEPQATVAHHQDDQNQVFVFEDDNSGSEDDENDFQNGQNPRPPFNGNPGDENAPGPAAPGRNLPPARAIGAKKAKSLARRDQRRAYHEFLRNQGEAQRAQEAEGAAEREALLSTEREKRAAAASAIEAKRALERQAKREDEARERERERLRREGPVRLCREALEDRGMVSVWEIVDGLREVDVDEVWVEKMLRTAGVIGRGIVNGKMTMMTSTGWVVRVGAEDMQRAYQVAADRDRGSGNGTVEFADLGQVLQGILTENKKHS